MSGGSPSERLALLRSQLRVKLPAPTASFAGETVIVTGSNTGLGMLAAQEVLRLGATKVILAVRTVSKGEDARTKIEAASNRPGATEVWPLDMASYKSVQAFAARAAKLDRLDAVILNAGVWPNSHAEAEGSELTITVNVLSTFLLFDLLEPTLRRTARAHNKFTRATVVDSALHKFALLQARHSSSIFTELAKPLHPKRYDARYHDSKMLVMLYGRAVAAAIPLAPASTEGVVLNMVNPGWCYSELHRDHKPIRLRLMEPVLCRSTMQGAYALVDAVRPLQADEARQRHGAYVDDCTVKKPSAWLDTEDGAATQARVWTEMNAVFEQVAPGVTHELEAKA